MGSNAENQTSIKSELESHFVDKIRKENSKLLKLQEDSLVKRQKVIQLKLKVNQLNFLFISLLRKKNSYRYNEVH